jgi:ketosteroid isomerase-like protein
MQGKGFQNMKETRTSFLTFFVVALVLSTTASVAIRAQEKNKETQKPATTVDAWRQALPPEAETERPAAEPANSAQPRPSREEVEKSLLAIERKWMEALKLRDASVLSQIVSDDFTLVSPRLVLTTRGRDKYFAHALRDLNLASYDFSEPTVRLYGRTAIVSGQLKQNATVAGEDWSGTYLITDVWVNRDGIWQVVSRHASLLNAKK